MWTARILEDRTLDAELKCFKDRSSRIAGNAHISRYIEGHTRKSLCIVFVESSKRFKCLKQLGTKS